jgi:hypothetical protein
MSADNKITIYYGADMDDATWTQLTVVTSNGLQDIRVPDRAGISGRLFRYKFRFERGADDMSSPVMRYYQTDTMRLLPATYGYGLRLDLTRNCRGRTPKKQLEELLTLNDPRLTPLFYPFAFRRDDASDVQTWWGRITHLNGVELGGTQHKGEGEWMISYVAPYSQDCE